MSWSLTRTSRSSSNHENNRVQVAERHQRSCKRGHGAALIANLGSCHKTNVTFAVATCGERIDGSSANTLGQRARFRYRR